MTLLMNSILFHVTKNQNKYNVAFEIHSLIEKIKQFYRHIINFVTKSEQIGFAIYLYNLGKKNLILFSYLLSYVSRPTVRISAKVLIRSIKSINKLY